MVRSLRTGDIAQTLAADRLGVPSVLYFVLGAAAPLTVIAGTVPTAYAVTGNLGLPVAFVAVGALLAVFAVGYVAMSRHLPHAGAFYAYVGLGLGRPAGVAAAWISLCAYNAIQCCLYGAIGAAISPLVQAAVGIEFPWWVFALAAWVLVAVLGMAKVDLNGTVLAALLIAEIVLVVSYTASLLAHPAHGYAVQAWSPVTLVDAGAGAVLAIGILGYVGFESAVVFSEESKDPRRTVPAATYLALALIAGLYGVAAWAMTVAAGSDAVVPAAQERGTDLLFTLAGSHLGTVWAQAGHVLFGTSIIAAMISFHNTIARYVFALGREGVLPPVFARTSPTGAPRAGSLVQTLIALTVIVGFAVAGADPVIALFYLLSTAGALGILILLVLAASAVLGYFATDHRGEGLWRTTIAPLISLVGLGLMLVLVLATLATLLGVADTSPLRWGIPATYAGVSLAGIGYGLWLRARRPAVYQKIGHGPRAALTQTPTTPWPSPVEASSADAHAFMEGRPQ